MSDIFRAFHVSTGKGESASRHQSLSGGRSKCVIAGSVGKVSGYRLKEMGSIPDRGTTHLSTQSADQLRGPASLLYNDYRGAERLGHEEEHSESNSDVKHRGVITLLPHTSSCCEAYIIK
jgi:hypothetical protein